MVLDIRAPARQVDRLRIGNEKDGMRIAHGHTAGIIQRPGTGRDMHRISGFGQGDLPPIELGFAHVNGDQPAGTALALQKAATGFEHGRVPAALAHQELGDAATAVAAGLGLAAVAIVDAQEGHGGAVGRFQDQDLITTNAPTPVGDCPGLLLGQAQGILAGIDHHKVVAETMHLGEGALFHGPHI